jgi:integrase
MRAQLSVADATLVSVLAYAGLRPGEALGLRWPDVGDRRLAVERAVAYGQVKSTKTGRSRAVVFPRRDGTPWSLDDWRNWRKRVYAPAASSAGLEGTRPHDLRASFVSLLIFEGRTVIEVARQAGHSPETCLRNYARVFADFEPTMRNPAEEQIRDARATVAEERRWLDARDRVGRMEDVELRLREVARGRLAALQPSRRPDSNRGPLHYE